MFPVAELEQVNQPEEVREPSRDPAAPSQDSVRERGDWGIRWACTHGRLHLAPAGPKSLATQEVQPLALERPCPRHQARPANYLVADWMVATLAGRPFPSERWYVEASGQIVKTPL